MIRPGEWWASRMGPLLAIGYAFIAFAQVGAGRSYRCLIALLISATLLAGYAYVVNDSCDVDLDRSAGKPNSMSGIRPTARAGLALCCAALGLAPWALVAPGSAGWAALAGIVALPLLYSVPPVRLKQRGALGLVSDALNMHALPTLFVAALFCYRTHTAHSSALWFTAAVAIWSLCLGLRTITRHQVLDREDDERAGVQTFVVMVGEVRAKLIVRCVFFPLEMAALAAMSILIGLHWPPVLIACVGFVLLHRTARSLSWRSNAAASVPSAPDDYVVLVEFYQLWPAILLAGCAAVVDPAFVWLIPTHIALFIPTVRKQSVDLWHQMVDLWHLALRTARQRVRGLLSARPPVGRPRTAAEQRHRRRSQL